MILDQQVVIPVPVERAWDFLMDIPAVSRCVPGVESIEQLDDDRFAGSLKVKVGPIGVTLKGTVTVTERDSAAYRSRMDVQASDRRLNSAVSAHAVMTLVPRSPTETEMQIHTESSILGKLGEFGQAVMRKKADPIIAEFGRNMARELSAT